MTIECPVGPARVHSRATARKRSLSSCPLLLAGAILAGIVLAGCQSGPYESAPVDAGKARATLTKALDSWKAGESVDSLQAASPAIVVQDFDWSAGKKLVGYEVLGPGKAVDANLLAQVRVTLEDHQGKTTEKTVHYVVGTAPVLTVFRDSFQ